MRFKSFKLWVLLSRPMFVWSEFQALNYSERLWISDGGFGESRVRRYGILGFRRDGTVCRCECGQYIRSAGDMSYRERVKLWWG